MHPFEIQTNYYVLLHEIKNNTYNHTICNLAQLSLGRYNKNITNNLIMTGSLFRV